jgi:hypothetical protein
MVAHQDVRMDSPTGPLADLSQCFQKTRAITIILEDIFPPVATTHDVVKRPLKFDPHFSRHSPFFFAPCRQMQEKRTDPYSPLASP